MKLSTVVLVTACAAFASNGVSADDSKTLIKMDKAWGSAQSPGEVDSMFTSDFIAIDEDGVSGKAEQLKGLETPTAGPYVAGDYKIEFLDAKTAVMVHSTESGDDAHWSMHVWRKNDGKWQIAASSSVEVDDD